MFPSLFGAPRSRRGPRSRRARSGPVPRRGERAPAAATASGSRSMPRSRRSGRALEERPACPPPPTVASTTRPGGTGGQELDHLPAHHRLMLELRAPRPLVSRPGPATSPPDNDCRSVVSPNRLGWKAGGEGLHRVARGAGGGPVRTSPSIVNCSVLVPCLRLVRSRSRAGRRTRSGCARPPGRAPTTGWPSQISIREKTPATTTSRSRPAYSRRFCGIATRPCLSGSTSAAPAKNERAASSSPAPASTAPAPGLPLSPNSSAVIHREAAAPAPW